MSSHSLEWLDIPEAPLGCAASSTLVADGGRASGEQGHRPGERERERERERDRVKEKEKEKEDGQGGLRQE